jgi:tetratricopeptide (TPR) repeat protein
MTTLHITRLLLVAAAMLAGCSRADDGLPSAAPTEKTGAEKVSVIFTDAQGRTLTADDLRNINGTVDYSVVGNQDVSAEAHALHDRGREAGARGDYPAAIAAFEQAAKLAPQWPYPVYDLAYTQLLMGDAEAARGNYHRTVELAPRGFFTALTAVDALDREKSGDLPPGTYAAYLSLEWVDDPKQKADLVAQLTEHVPQFAPGWKEAAFLATDDAQQIERLERGLAANPDPETRGMLMINRALLMDRRGEHRAAIESLGALALDADSPLDIQALAKVSLKQMLEAQ